MQMAGRGGESLLQELFPAVHTRGGRRLLKDGLLMSEQALRWLLIRDQALAIVEGRVERPAPWPTSVS